ncbi:YbaB/EbfC family nucleoid-associated protein [Rhabdochlamydiaceae symbiont of Dictyostelium giganteum]|uniref:YbaB/EbfC family nucleoid-associated protein n=1 Tax=Rhabdochlamydiaceae symbiont of Dictyostelium giganteum TaxID=3342349 RepID=UPI0038513574
MGHGFSKIKKQAKQMEAQYSKMQEELKLQEVTGTSGAGLVSITLCGDYSMKKIAIKPSCIDPNDIEGLQDLIEAAYSDALKQIKDQSSAMLPGMPFSF